MRLCLAALLYPRQGRSANETRPSVHQALLGEWRWKAVKRIPGGESAIQLGGWVLSREDLRQVRLDAVIRDSDGSIRYVLTQLSCSGCFS